MKAPRIYLAMALLAAAISVSQQAYAADINKDNPAAIKQANNPMHKIQADIDADRGNIIEESKAINADRQRLKEAEKMADKERAGEIKHEIARDIEKREAAIKDLKKDINDKKEQKFHLIYGNGQKIPKRRIKG